MSSEKAAAAISWGRPIKEYGSGGRRNMAKEAQQKHSMGIANIVRSCSANNVAVHGINETEIAQERNMNDYVRAGIHPFEQPQQYHQFARAVEECVGW